MLYVYLTGSVVVVSNTEPKQDFLAVESLPEGEGRLCTDLKTVWREQWPRPEKAEIPMDTCIKAISDRQEFLEDCIAEMAMVVYQ